uniref:Uncharacterized protein n=2 Tax=Brassica TaxID=3705 RepID=A0A0D3A578_BRAOL
MGLKWRRWLDRKEWSFGLLYVALCFVLQFKMKKKTELVLRIEQSNPLYIAFEEVGGSTRDLTIRGDWRSLFCSITELPQTKLLKSATLDCSLLKVEAERTDPEAGGEEEVDKAEELGGGGGNKTVV